jgi:peptidoglycan/LPS O-acetylase OafA/YrhL
MLGTFKLLLSLLVISSHIDLYLKIPGFNWFHQGVSAVIGFYILSGYFTSHLLTKKFDPNFQTIIFYLERFFRISIQYYFYTLLTIIFLLVSNYQKIIPSFSAIISNLLIIPLNLHQFFYVSFFPNSDYALIPPAWYLATLLQYYFLAPFLVKSKKLKYSIFVISLLTFISAVFGTIPTIYYGSRFLGTFVFFLIGDFLYQYQISKKDNFKIVLAVIYLGFISFYLLAQNLGKLKLDYNGPVLLVFLVLFPIIVFLINKPLKISFKNIDRKLGDLSYPMFLNHFLLLWICNYLQIYINGSNQDKLIRMSIITSTSVILATLTNFFEKKLLKTSKLTKTE